MLRRSSDELLWGQSYKVIAFSHMMQKKVKFRKMRGLVYQELPVLHEVNGVYARPFMVRKGSLTILLHSNSLDGVLPSSGARLVLNFDLVLALLGFANQ